MDITRLIDINENRHRYYFTREATQRDMSMRYNVKVETIGKYYPNRSLATVACPPLAIQLKGQEECVSAAFKFVQQVLENGPPTSTTQSLSVGIKQRKVYLGFMPEVGRVGEVRAFLLGPPPGASFLTYIARTAGPGVSVVLRGQGSGHVELGASMEHLSEPMHVLIRAGSDKELANAVMLAEDLTMVVRHAYERRIKLF
jgi:hypothetical protein